MNVPKSIYKNFLGNYKNGLNIEVVYMKVVIEEKWERIEELLDLVVKQLEIDRRKEELKRAFVEEFGIEPQKVSVDMAYSEFSDRTLPDNIRTKIHDLLYDLGIAYDYFMLFVRVRHITSSEQHDWKVERQYGSITLTKRENSKEYELEILPCFYDE